MHCIVVYIQNGFERDIGSICGLITKERQVVVCSIKDTDK
jgi:hypothetical protein